jgi:hypothetical protein
MRLIINVFLYRNRKMINTQKKTYWVDIDGDALRKYIDDRSVFTALEAARKNVAEVRSPFISVPRTFSG